MPAISKPLFVSRREADLTLSYGLPALQALEGLCMPVISFTLWFAHSFDGPATVLGITNQHVEVKDHLTNTKGTNVGEIAFVLHISGGRFVPTERHQIRLHEIMQARMATAPSQNIMQSALCNNIVLYFENQVSSDVIVKAGYTTVHAHKLILAAQSPFFRAMFQVDPMLTVQSC